MIDESIKNLVKLIKVAESLSIPLTNTVDHSPTMIDSILMLISLRNYKHRQWQRNNVPSLNKEVNYLNRLIKAHVKSFNNERWNNRLSQLKKHSNQLWKVTKLVNNRTTKIPPLKTTSRILTTDSHKANEIGTAFCRAHSTTYNDFK